jgi:hypothetical protein
MKVKVSATLLVESEDKVQQLENAKNCMLLAVIPTAARTLWF